MLAPIWISLLLTIFLMVLHFLAPHLRRFPLIPEVCTLSFSGGFAVAYVFLHLLPGLAEHGETIGTLLAEYTLMTPFKNLMIYLMSLVGFIIFLTLDRMAKKREEMGKGENFWGFTIHLSTVAIYNIIVTYTLPVQVEADLGFALVFSLMMGLHFVTLDRNLEEHFPTRFDHQGRLILMLALLAGWLIAFLTKQENIYLAGLLTALIGGAILMNVFRHELPAFRSRSYGWFLVGAGFGTALLLLVTLMEPHEENHIKPSTTPKVDLKINSRPHTS